jgi:cell division protein FtsQ
LAISILRHAERRRLLARPWQRLAAAALVVALAAGGVLALSRSALFRARTVRVTGATVLHRPEVLATAGISSRTNVLWLDAGEAERRLEADPWVADARVVPSAPSSITIALTESVPVALVRGEAGSLLVAADGTVLGPPPRPALARGLPEIRLPIAGGSFPSHVVAARVIGAMAPDVREQVASLTVHFDRTLWATLRDGTRIELGPATDLAAKARAIERVLAWATAEGATLTFLSVVAPSAPAGTLAD